MVWRWGDIVVVAIALVWLAGAVAYAFTIDPHGDGSSWQIQKRDDDRMLKPHCRVAPNGADGIPCSWTTLDPPRPPY